MNRNVLQELQRRQLYVDSKLKSSGIKQSAPGQYHFTDVFYVLLRKIAKLEKEIKKHKPS